MEIVLEILFATFFTNRKKMKGVFVKGNDPELIANETTKPTGDRAGNSTDDHKT